MGLGDVRFPGQSGLWRRSALGWLIGLAGVCSLGGGEALAAPITLLSVTGAGNTGQAMSTDQGAAVSFTLNQLYTDVAISADIVCVGCEGAIYLMKDLIGPAASVANLVAAAAFDVGSSVDPLFSGLALEAGNYFLILAITTAGGASWLASDPFVLATAPGVSMGLNYFAGDLDNSVPFRSLFTPIRSAAALHFTIVGEVATVPEPATVMLIATGLALLARRRSRHRATTRHR